MATLKKYDGTIITLPSHTHIVNDTINSNGTIAIATTTSNGFISSTDKTELENLKTLLNTASEKIIHGIY